MAVPQGSFSAGAAGVSAPGGAFNYVPASIWGAGMPHYYGGTFFIDTGYDDPVIWTTGVEAAELYGARVYGATGVVFPDPGPSIYTGKWYIAATPVWQTRFSTAPASSSRQARILIECQCYLLEPVSEADGSYQRMDSVNWSLYRV